MNHPKRKVLSHIASNVLSVVGQDSTDVKGNYEHLDNTRLPVYESVRAVLSRNIDWNLAVSRQEMELEAYYMGHAKVLRSIQPEFLRSAYKKFLRANFTK